ncbi:alcohol dehydrogenase catalytic domain-containing protein [Amycolatopsis sacchari]|uniref:alcohol dehydrogenase catalytic domain-containing protein n=1 Tax=Amycolatopsis sacchari TaxID=115433 RepID=UPI003D753A98
MRTTTGWQSLDPATNALTRVTIERRDLRPDDIAVRIDYCGVCHSDLHRIHGMLGEQDLVPGHEATGVVVALGQALTISSRAGAAGADQTGITWGINMGLTSGLRLERHPPQRERIWSGHHQGIR